LTLAAGFFKQVIEMRFYGRERNAKHRRRLPERQALRQHHRQPALRRSNAIVVNK